MRLFSIRRTLWLPIGLVLALVLLPSAGLASSGPANDGSTWSYGRVTPTSTTRTIQYFGDSFSYNNVTYPYTMVGTNLATSWATTTVPVLIVPLRFVFPDGHEADPAGAIRDVQASPLFTSASFTTGVTQYGDAIRRAMFWQDVSGTNYHVLLASPTVLPTQTLVVPPNALVMVVSRNAVLTSDPVPTGLPLLGFHKAAASTNSHGVTTVRTAIWADYAEPYVAAEAPTITQNVDILSHEVAEWLHDPFLTNVVPTWQSPLPLASLFYGCSSFLETGDRLADVGFQVNGYQLQDEAFLSWFAKQPTSIGINGQYTYLGTFTQPSPVC